MDALVAELSEIVKGKTLSWLCSRGVLEVASLTVNGQQPRLWERRGARSWCS